MNKIKFDTSSSSSPTRRSKTRTNESESVSNKNSSICNRSFYIKAIRRQWSAIAAIVASALIAFFLGYDSYGFSIVAVILLAAVVYTSLRFGIRQGLISATLTLTYNTIFLIGVVDAFAFSGNSIRRALILIVVLPVIAIIVGRLKERNENLLEHEKEARRKVEESEERLRFMAESMPQKIFTITAAGDLDYVNPQWTEYTGWSLEQMKKNDLSQLIHPKDVTKNQKLWERSFETGEPFTYEHRILGSDSKYRWHITRARAMRDDNGNVKMWIGSSTDINDIKSSLQREQSLEKTAARLTEQREQLLELNRAKEEFISLASHQLRTPATGVKQYIGMILEGYAGDTLESQLPFLKQAYESNEREITIINDLLKVAKADAGKIVLNKEKTDIISLIKSIIDEQSSVFALRKQTIAFHPKQRALHATIDQHNIRMVLENIIDNASKYSPSHKKIGITVKKTKSTIAISIKDEGVGIEQKDLDKLFLKFSRIDNPLSVQVGGSGLGLYWAQKIIDLHGGTIELESELNIGSIFTVKLPI